MSPRILTPLIIAADALLAVVLGVLVPLACTSAIWVAAGLTGDWGIALATAVGAWALSLGGDLVVTLDTTLLAPLGLTDPVAFGVGLAPLSLTLATVIPALRSGARLRDDDVPLALGMVGPLVFGLATWGLCAVASHPSVAIDALGTGLVGALIYAASSAVGARVWERIPGDWLEHSTAGWGRDGLIAMARGAGIMIAGLVGAGSLALLAAVVIGMGRILSIFQALHLDVVGAIAFGVGQLALIPNAIAWAIAWLLGPGFTIGEGSSVSPMATNVGPLPLVPILGALPESIPPIVVVIVVVPVAVGILAGLAMRLAPGADDWHTGWRRLATPLVAATAGALAIAFFALASGGAVGPGRLASIGPHAGWVLLAAFATLAVGALTGAFVPLAEVEAPPAAARAADSKGRPGEDDGGKAGKGEDNAGKAGKGDDDAVKAGKGEHSGGKAGKVEDNGGNAGKGEDSGGKAGKVDGNAGKAGKVDGNAGKAGKVDGNAGKASRGNDGAGKAGTGKAGTGKASTGNDRAGKVGTGKATARSSSAGIDNAGARDSAPGDELTKADDVLTDRTSSREPRAKRSESSAPAVRPTARVKGSDQESAAVKPSAASSSHPTRRPPPPRDDDEDIYAGIDPLSDE